MKTLQSTLFALTGLALSASAEIISFAQYNLGEQDLSLPPLDSSENGRDFTLFFSQEDITVGTGGEIAAPASTAFLQLGHGGYFNAPFAALDNDNFAFGIYARASSNTVIDGEFQQHVFQTGDRGQASVRISLAANGWEASYQPVGNFPFTEVSIGSPGSFVPNEWVHLAVIRSNGETSFYINGVAQGPPETTTTPAHGNAHLGINPGGTASFQGDVDAMRALTFTYGESVASIIAALQGIDSEPDGLFDDFEQRIVDASLGDSITDISLVSPGDDFDGDSLTNLEEQNGVSDPTDPNDPPPPLSTELELLAFWDFNEPIDLGEFIADDLTGEIPDLVAEYGLFVQELFFTEDGGGFSGQAGDFALDYSNEVFIDPADPENEIDLSPLVVVDDSSNNGSDFLAAINSTTSDDRLVISFWQRLEVVQDSSAFEFVTANGTRGMLAHSPWGSSEIFFDHELTNDGTRNRLRGFAPDRGDPPAAVDYLQWHHFLYVKDLDTKEMFLDGELVLSGGGLGLPTNIEEFFVGSNDGGANAIDGFIDEVAIFNMRPSDAQIAALAAGVSPIDVLDIVAVPPPAGFIDAAYTREGDILTLTFDSDGNEFYTIRYSLDLESFENVIAEELRGDLDSTETTLSFDLGEFGIENEKRIFFRIELLE